MWLEYARKVKDMGDRKILTVGTIYMITDAQYIANKDLNATLPAMVKRVIEVFQIDPEKEKKSKEEKQQHRLEVLESQGFGARFSGLMYARTDARDPTKDCGDLRKLLVTRVAKVINGNTAMMASLSRALGISHAKVFNQYCRKFQVACRLPV